MSKTTEEMLLEVHGAPIVPLKDVCQKYIGIGPFQARIRANKNTLPFPAFRLDPENSHRSPWVVALKDIAAFIDAKAEAATKSWNQSKV
jgi:hypothetical protein